MKILALNQKLYLKKDDAIAYVEAIKSKTREGIELVICPSSIYLPYFMEHDFKLGAQNLSKTFATGEVAGEQLKSMGCEYVVIGHSERRHALGEADSRINLNVIDAIENGIKPILCCGETIEDREAGKMEEVVLNQLKADLENVEITNNIIIAYEPVWAIGSGLIPTNEDIYKAMQLIKNFIRDQFYVDVYVLYGGSVDDNNIANLSTIENCDGFLVGRAGANIEKTLGMINNIN